MRFHCILCTRDCADILVESLQAKADWADFVYVYDTGSTDGTWEMVQDIAKKNPRVVPFKREEILFHEGIRGYVFNAFRDNMEDGDWIVKSDEDEFYHTSPRDFVANNVREHETVVWEQLYEFRLTHEEAAQQQDPDFLVRERTMPLVQRRRYYIPVAYSEHRLCRYRSNMKWYPTHSFPKNAGFVARARIPIRHYPHRDVEQLKQRVRLRQALLKVLPSGIYPHWRCQTWKDFIVSRDLSELKFWPLSESLPPYWFSTHLAPPYKRVVQWLLHSCAVRVLDRLRKPYPMGYKPEPLPQEVALELSAASFQDTQPYMMQSRDQGERC